MSTQIMDNFARAGLSNVTKLLESFGRIFLVETNFARLICDDDKKWKIGLHTGNIFHLVFNFCQENFQTFSAACKCFYF